MKSSINILFTLSFLAISAIANASTNASNLEPVWEVTGLLMPESVAYDKARDRYYVSNINGEPLKKDNEGERNGSIALIEGDGGKAIIEWVKGLSSPKGIELVGDKLYVADVKELVVIDVKQGAVVARYPAPEAKALNGITTYNSRVFVSDWMGNAIYTLENNKLVAWLEDDNLDMPNGLYAKAGYLYVGAWGKNMRSDFSTENTGSLKRISLETKKIQTLTDSNIWMNLDGLHVTESDEWLATDFLAGKLLVMNSEGNIKTEYALPQSSADFYYSDENDLLVVPLLMGGKVIAYRLKK